MGLFDNLFHEKSGSSRELSKQEAFAGILLGASACDGHSSQEEVQSLFTTTGRMRMFENSFAKEFFGSVAENPFHRWAGEQHGAFVVQNLNDVQRIFYERPEITFTSLKSFLGLFPVGDVLGNSHHPENFIRLVSHWKRAGP